MMDVIGEFCSANDLPWNEEIAGRFERYLELLLHFNESMNLIGPLDESEIIDELFIDSLAAAAIYPPEGTLLDVGTGAGLPGYPLAFLYPDLAVTLVEPRRRRATFLKIVRTRLELDGITLYNNRLEDVPSATYDYVIAKAFRPPIEWLETASEWTSESGVTVCMHWLFCY